MFLFTAFAPSTSKSSGTSAVYCSFPPSIRIWLKFAWICGFRYHFTLNKPAGIESIQTHPKTSRENFPFGKSPKKKTLRLTLKYIATQASFCLCATMEDNAKVTRALIALYLVRRGSIEGKLLISYPNNWLSKLLTHSDFTNVSVFRSALLFTILFTLIHDSNLFRERISLISFGWTLKTLLFALCPTSFGFNWTKLNARRVERKIQLFLFLGYVFTVFYFWTCAVFTLLLLSRGCVNVFPKPRFSDTLIRCTLAKIKNSPTMLFFLFNSGYRKKFRVYRRENRCFSLNFTMRTKIIFDEKAPNHSNADSLAEPYKCFKIWFGGWRDWIMIYLFNFIYSLPIMIAKVYL